MLVGDKEKDISEAFHGYNRMSDILNCDLMWCVISRPPDCKYQHSTGTCVIGLETEWRETGILSKLKI